MSRSFARTAVLAAGVMVLLAAGLYAQAGLSGLGVSERRASGEVVNALASGYVPVELAAKAFRSAPPATREAMVKAAFAWARAYTESAAVRAQYEEAREADAPEPPAEKGDVDEELAAERAQQKKQIEEMRANVAKMPPELRAQMEETIKEIEAQTAAMEKDPQMSAMRRQGAEAQRADDQRAYEGRLAAHEKRFPADPRVLVARRLTEFLDMSKDVDFGAKLVPRPGGKQVFADPAYEEKPREWKLCYRAGAEAVHAARAAAADWLQSLKGR